jgi:hypothetical protein
MIAFIDTLFTQFVLRGNAALSLIYTIYNSPSHTHTHTHQDSQSLLVASWQRIYHSLTVTATQTWRLSLSLIFSCNFLRLPISKTRPNSLPSTVLYSYSFWTPNSNSLISVVRRCIPILLPLFSFKEPSLHSRGTDHATQKTHVTC